MAVSHANVKSAKATRASLGTAAFNEEPDAAEDNENRRRQDGEAAQSGINRRALERRLIRRPLEEELARAGPGRGAILEFGEPAPAAAGERRQLGELQELGELRRSDRVRPYG